ncbi:hypothetical protein Tco_0268413 [Tanacetum coccineum]
MITFYELYTKRKLNLNYLRVWCCKAVVRLPDREHKTLCDRDVDCMFIGYDEHSKAFRFYVIEPNEFVSTNSISESRDVNFDEIRFSPIPGPSQRSLTNGTDDDIGVQRSLMRSLKRLWFRNLSLEKAKGIELQSHLDMISRTACFNTFLEHDSKHQSYGSCVVAAATVGIPASIRRLPKNLLDRVSQLR